MRAPLVLLPLIVLAISGCSSECYVKPVLPKDAKESAALKDAQARAAGNCVSPTKCEYRIVQSPEGLITIHVNYLYDEAAGGGCGGDIYEEWTYNPAGELVKGR